jgi:pimeloyl-ACP methyl ester carboxylesterase
VVTQIIGVSDTRSVTVDCWGDPDGFPVFLLHGTPGSRSGPVPRASVLYRLGVQLVCYDRPGYGSSGRDKGRSVASAAHDVLAIADELQLDTFGVIGRSGGGPHALACAALISDARLRSVAVLVGLAPPGAEDLDWFEGMADSNVDEYEMATCHENDTAAAELTEDAVSADLAYRADQIRKDPEILLTDLKKEMSRPDIRIITDVGIRRQLTGTYKEALRDGAYGWIDDVLAFRRPWGFKLEDINKVPVLLWHGEEDVFSPAEHSRWLAKHIPTAKIEVQAGAAHFGAVEILPKLLARMKAESTIRLVLVEDHAGDELPAGELAAGDAAAEDLAAEELVSEDLVSEGLRI